MWAETGGWGWGWIGLGIVHMVLFWGLIILGIVALVKLVSDSGRSARSDEKTALEILKERYARGEIDRDEYLEKKRHLLE